MGVFVGIRSSSADADAGEGTFSSMRTLYLLPILATLVLSCARPPFSGGTDPVAALRTAGTKGSQVHVVKSPLDQREYAWMRLDNGLQALIISDPDTDMAAAALQVDVGHYADPADRQGLAHFLEHMLFMGTDQYPEVDEYRAFIEAHGGRTNAGTGPETTSYFFEVEHEALLPAFDRFSRFFVAPLLDPAYVERERNAVHAEYTMKIREHARRLRQVRKATTNPEHPEAKFSVGNLDTLADRPGETVHSALLALYEATYAPSRMTLAIIGREPVDVLRKRVEQNLSPIPVREAAEPPRPPPFLEDQLGVRIHVVPLDDRRELEISFPLPPQAPHWPARPYDHITWLLGHEGEGTLFASLKEKGFIERLSAYSYEGDDHATLTVRLDLTRSGLEQLQQVEAAVFQAIDLISREGVKESWFREQATMAELAFRYAEETPPASAVRAAAWALSEFPPGHVLDHSAQWSWKPDLVRDALARLRPENVRLILTAPGLETDRVEPLYDVPYSIRSLTEAERAQLVGGSALSFGLPAPNPYIPEALALESETKGPGVPVRIEVDDPRLEVWHQHDSSWGVPRAMVELRLYTPDPRADATRSLVLHELTTRLIQDSLQEFAYPLSLAGLSFEFSPSSEGLVLTVSGYDDRIQRLMTDLGRAVHGLEIDAGRFEVVREALVRDWRNLATARPISQTHTALAEALDPWRLDRQAAIPIAEALTLADVRAYAGGLLDEVDARLFVHGNYSTERARSLAQTVRDEFLRDARPAERPQRITRRIPSSAQLVLDLTIDHDDSTLVVASQGQGTSAADHARWQLLGKLLDTAFFTKLRTEQQLGYAVGAWYTTDDALPALRMSIQSAVAGPVTLEERVDAFLRDHRAALAEMSAADFTAVRSGVVASLTERPTRMADQAQRLRRDLYLGHHDFDFNQRVASEVEKLTLSDVLTLYDEVLLGETAGRVVVRSFGHAHMAEREGAKAGCATKACLTDSLPETHTRSL